MKIYSILPFDSFSGQAFFLNAEGSCAALEGFCAWRKRIPRKRKTERSGPCKHGFLKEFCSAGKCAAGRILSALFFEIFFEKIFDFRENVGDN